MGYIDVFLATAAAHCDARVCICKPCLVVVSSLDRTSTDDKSAILALRAAQTKESPSPENSRPDGAEPASGAEGGASASENMEEERLDNKALIDAADRGDLARVKELIEGMKTNGVDINRQDCYGLTEVIRACSNGFIYVVIELLKVDGLDANNQDSDGYTVLIWACSYGRTEVVVGLVKYDGLDVNVQDSSDGHTALSRACLTGHADIALALLRYRRVDRHIKTSYG